MTKKKKSVLNRVISKIGNLFRKPNSNIPKEKENNQNHQKENSTSIHINKEFQPDEQVLPEKISENEYSKKIEVYKEVKSENSGTLQSSKKSLNVKDKYIPENQTLKSPSNSEAKDSTDISKTHVKIDPKEYMSLEYKFKNSKKSKSEQKNTEKPEKSTIDVSKTHTLINPKEYLEQEYKLKEFRQSQKESAMKKPIVSTLKDEMKSDLKKSINLKDDSVIKTNKNLKLEEPLEKTKLEVPQYDSKKENRVKESNSKTNQQIDTKVKKHKAPEKINQTESMNLQPIHKDSEATTSIEIKNDYSVEVLEKRDLESKPKIEQKITIKNPSEDKTENILLDEDFDLEDDIEMDIEEDEIPIEYSTDDEYENIINYKESLHQYEEQIENYDDDDYDDFDLEDLFSDKEFQQELSEITYSDTNDYSENIQVIKKYQENPTNQQIFADIVEKNQPLVKKIVQRYLGAAANTSLTFEDLVNAGNIGMFTAIERFDPSSGFQFSTYATHWIAQRIRREIDNEGRMIRVPVHQVDNILKLTKIENKMLRDQSTIDDNRILTEMDITRKKLDELRYVRDTYRLVPSMDVPIGNDEGSTLGQFITPDNLIYPGQQTYLESPADRVEDEVFSEELIEWMATKLTEQEHDIVIRRNGLQGTKPETLEEIGKSYSVTRERIRQIEARAYKKLRKSIKSFINID